MQVWSNLVAMVSKAQFQTFLTFIYEAVVSLLASSFLMRLYIWVLQSTNTAQVIKCQVYI